MQYIKVSNNAEAVAAINDINTHEFAGLDTETTGLDPFNDKILSFQLHGNGSDKAYYFPSEFIKEIENLTIKVVLQNFKFDFRMLESNGINLDTDMLLHDTMLLDHLLDENKEHSLDAMIKERYQDDYKTVFWEKYKSFQEASEKDQIEYSCKDVIYTVRLYKDLILDLSKNNIPDSLIDNVRLLALVLYRTERTGIKIDLPYLSKIGEDLSIKISSLKKQLRNSADLSCQIIELRNYIKELDKRKTEKGRRVVSKPEFNFDSATQLCNLLYDELKLPVQLNKERNRTSDDNALSALEETSPFVKEIREYRGHQKVFTSFIEGTLEKIQNGRVHPSFNINGTVTGRISSSSPNMQQLPSEGGVRGIYVPDEKNVFISSDYKQLEVTLAAHFSRDENLLKIVNEGISQHDITAKGLGIDRSVAKRINFAMQYGAGTSKIQSILECSKEDSERVYAKYWETYKGLRDFILTIHDKLDRGEPIVTPWGRKRRFPQQFQSKWEKLKAQRQAANFIIQSTGADITSRAVCIVDKKLRECKDNGIGKVVFSVHDEVLIQAKIEHKAEAQEILTSSMVEIGKELNLTVPLQVDCSGPMERWLD